MGTFGTACSVDLGGRPFVTFPIFMPTDKRAPWEMSCDGETNMQVVETSDNMYFLFQKTCNEDSSPYRKKFYEQSERHGRSIFFTDSLMAKVVFLS